MNTLTPLYLSVCVYLLATRLVRRLEKDAYICLRGT